MASAIRAAALFLLVTCSLSLASSDPTPAPWPEQFHSLLFDNYSGSLRITDLWYDYPNGRNINIIRYQLGKLLYDVEWTNGSSYYYTLDANEECRVVQFEVGILPPDWLSGADYLGQAYQDGFLCNVWTKVDFIWYYEDVVTKRPVYWVFYDGLSMNVMTFEVGAVLLEDKNWQAPAYCFGNKGEEKSGSRSGSERSFFSYFKDSSSITKTSSGTMSV